MVKLLYPVRIIAGMRLAYKRVLKNALGMLSPTPSEEREVLSAARRVQNKLEKAVKLEVFLGGSIAKGTWLRGARDIDFFVRFPLAEFKGRSAELADLIAPKIKSVYPNAERLHGSRDYFRFLDSGFAFEVVPILKINRAEQALNITDISPLHVRWVLRNANAGMKGEIRLLKGFLAAAGLYGAESHIMGFSGYVCEVLTIHCGGFMGVLKEAAGWMPGKWLDPAGHFRSRQEALLALNKSKLGPLVLIDPVQANRNAAAALSIENFRKFKGLCRDFIRCPSEAMFVQKRIEEKKLRTGLRGRELVWLEVEPLKGKRDIVGAKLRSFLDRLAETAEREGFKVEDKGWQWHSESRAEMWLVFSGRLPKEREVFGPPLSFKENVAEFKKTHPNARAIKGRLVAVERRRFTEPLDFVKYACKLPHLKARVGRVMVR